MRLNTLIAVVGGLIFAPAAFAGCCGGASPVPHWLDRSERLLVGADLRGRVEVSRWDAAGRVRAASGASDTLTPRFAIAWRPSRALQLSASLPAVVRHVRTSEASAWGAALGDLELNVAADPFTPPGNHLPFLSVRARLPTGRTAVEATAPMAADTSGEPGSTLRAGGGVQGGDDVMIRVEAEGGARLAPGRTGAVLGLGVAIGAPVGHARCSATLRADVLWPQVGTPVVTAATRAGFLAILPVRRGRGWISADVDLPIPGWGIEAPIGVGFGGGIAFVGVRR
jgi:hypothetical protein